MSAWCTRSKSHFWRPIDLAMLEAKEEGIGGWELQDKLEGIGVRGSRSSLHATSDFKHTNEERILDAFC